MISGVHLLLTYTCTYECDHCFVYSGPEAEGTMSLARIREILVQSRGLGTVKWIYFEGGEPFLFYATLLEAVKLARYIGFEVGIVTNAYWATSVEDALLALEPLAEAGIADLSVSHDDLHGDAEGSSGPRRVLEAAKRLAIPASTICIEKPHVRATSGPGPEKGAPILGGGALLKGRAADRLTDGLPRRPWTELDSCPHEELVAPERVHVDPYGFVHLCQGIVMGNLLETPLVRMVEGYEAERHPICGPIVAGGPARLAKRHGLAHDDAYVDECHFCFDLRRRMRPEFEEFLGPPQVYGPTALPQRL